MPTSTRSSVFSEPVDANFAYFLAKPFVAWNPVLSGVHAWMHTCTIAQATIQREVFAFVERRLQAEAAQMQRLNQTAADDTWRVCYEFYEKTLEDYRAECGQLATLGSNLLNETMAGTMKALAPAAAEKPLERTSTKTELAARRTGMASG